jgi:hypothetical protein
MQEFLQNNMQTKSVVGSSASYHHLTSSSLSSSSSSNSATGAARGFGFSSAHVLSSTHSLHVITGNDESRVRPSDADNSGRCSPQTFGDRVRELIVRSMIEDNESDSNRESPPGSTLLAALKPKNSCVTVSSWSHPEAGAPRATPEPSRLLVKDDPVVLPPPAKRRLFESSDRNGILHKSDRMATCASETADGYGVNGFVPVTKSNECLSEPFTRSAQASRLQVGHFEQYEDGLSVFADVASRMPTIPANPDVKRQTVAYSSVGQYTFCAR